MTIVSAFPFAIVLIFALYGLLKALRVEGYKRESMQFATQPALPDDTTESWKKRLKTIVDFPNKSTVDRYLGDQVKIAFDAIAEEFRASNLKVTIRESEGIIALAVQHGDEPEFVYQVHRQKHVQPDFASGDLDDDDEESYYRAEVHLSEGGQDYCIMGWSQLAVINDIIEQYRKHLHFLHLLRSPTQ